MVAGDRIPIAWSVRWRYFRQLALPALAFGLTGLVVLKLWTNEHRQWFVPGVVDAPRVQVTVLTAGQLLPLPQGTWTLFDAVDSGDVIARLDDSHLRAELETLARERQHLEGRLAAAAADFQLDQQQRQLDQQREAVRLQWQVAQRRLDVLDRRVQIAEDDAEVERLTARLDLAHSLSRTRLVPPLELADVQGQLEVVRKRLVEHRRALAESESQLRSESGRLQQLAQPLPAEAEQILAPFRAELAVHEAQLDALQMQFATLEIQAPISGTICNIHRWPGQMVQAGDPIVTIAAEQGRFVVSYVRQQQQVQTQTGMPVSVRSRRHGSLLVSTRLLRIGPQYEAVPLEHLGDVQVPEWGLPVAIELPPALDLRPGEKVDVVFPRAPSRVGGFFGPNN